MDAEDDVLREANGTQQPLERAVVARPELVLIRHVRPDIHEMRIFFVLRDRREVLVDDGVDHPLVAAIIVALEARR